LAARPCIWARACYIISARMRAYQGDKALWRQVRAEKKKRRHVFWTIALLSLAYMFAIFMFGDMGYIKYRKLRNMSRSMHAQIARLKDENARIKNLLEDYRKNDYLVEKHAREDYGLARKGEYIFLFEDEKK
jgi:cell division protein FtsB